MPSVVAESINNLTFNTEIYPPYNLTEQGKLQGISVDLLILMLKNMKTKHIHNDIRLAPWARGYQTALKQKNACVFSTTRTKEREHKFKWVGPIISTTISVFAKKEKHIKIHSIQDLKKYRTGVVIDDIGEQLLVAQGIKLKNLDRMSGVHVILQSIQKLNKNRIDLFAYEENATKWTIKKQDFNPDHYEVVYMLKKGELYYACNKRTSNKLLQQLQRALDHLKVSGEYQQILNEYR